MPDNQLDHVFWFKRWQAAKTMARSDERFALLSAVNYVSYLSAVFSWLFEHRRVRS